MSQYFDLHCDTLMRCVETGKTLEENDFSIDLKRGNTIGKWVQAFAAFVHDDLAEDGYMAFLKMAQVFEYALQNSGQLVEYNPHELRAGVCNGMLTVEGGAALGGQLSRLEEMRRRNVRILSLVWNKETDYAGGIESEAGLKEKGKDAIREMENCQIILDVSHMSERTFWETCDVAKRPFIATHSNSFSVCPHPRNLKDEQVKEIVAREGLIGLNYHIPFVVAGKTEVLQEDLCKHIDTMLQLGAENTLALGSDFDGADMPEFLKSIEKIPSFYTYCVERYGQNVSRKLFFENANHFFKKHSF